jgi:hypothetical protein
MQDTGLKRNTTDQFYTKKEVANTCLDHWYKIVNPKEDELIIEPSAGNGAFSSKIMESHISFQALDIDPKSKEIKKIDFLQLNIDLFPHKKIHFIGNPPFGRQSSLAKKFIKHICASPKTATISFILPKSFRKESMQRCFPLRYNIVFELEISKDAFLINEKAYNVPCVFQIWEKKDTDRYITPDIEPAGYSFVKKDENPDYSIRRVGVYAGSISTATQDKSSQSHYFIKLKENNELDINTYWTFIDDLDKVSTNTVGPKSISKKEIIPRLNFVVS